tara:strand:- start:313 stop:633 length:321 start_codon:yes stop_codon:yes gene_type:complete
MSLNVLTFIFVWIVAVSFCVDYIKTAKNKIVIFILFLFSLHCFIYGIYIFSSWSDVVSQKSVNWLSNNPGAESTPTVFLLIPLYPYVLLLFGFTGIITYSKYLRKK